MTELAVKNESTQVMLTEKECKDKALEYLRNMGVNLAPQYEYQFLDLCALYKLNPLKREIYAVPFKDKCNIIVGYETYIKRAERTGKLNGWDCKVEGNGQNMVAILTIWRKDWQHPFTHYVAYAEAVQKKYDGSVNSMWQKMPSFMLRKVAIAQGFRLCFPDELGGMPYTSDELPSVDDYDPTEDYRPTSYETVQAQQVVSPKDVQDAVVVNPEEVVKDLEKIAFDYKAQLEGGPLQMIYDCIADNGDCVAMLQRTKAYLGKKGIRV